MRDNETMAPVPQATDVEDAILGAILLEKDTMDKVYPILLTPDVFYKEANQNIYKACLSLYKSGRPIEMHMVSAEMKKLGTLEISGGVFYIGDITSKVSSAANVEYHATIIKEKYMRRTIIASSHRSIRDSYDETTDIFETIEALEKDLYDSNKITSIENMSSAPDLWVETIDDIEDRRRSKEEGLFTGIPSGFLEIDRVTQGWQRSDLIIIAARPGMGKTSFILAAARNAAVDFNEKVAIFSLEMSKVQLMQRLVSLECEIELTKLKSGSVNDLELKQIVNNNSVSKSGIFIDDTPGLSIMELRAATRKLKKDHNIGLIIIDYLQLMSGDRSQYKGNREQEIAQISRTLKGIAKDLDVPVIALSQLSRTVESRGGNKEPILSDLRESGAIEQDADLVGFLYRPDYYGITEDEDGNSLQGLGKLIIAKHRSGSLQHCFMKWVGKYTKWLSYTPPVQDTGNSKLIPMENFYEDNEDKDVPF